MRMKKIPIRTHSSPWNALNIFGDYFVFNFKFSACEILLDLPSILKNAYKLINYIYNIRCKVKGLLNFSPYCWQ